MFILLKPEVDEEDEQSLELAEMEAAYQKMMRQFQRDQEEIDE